MKNADELQNYKITELQNPQRGYILITLMLFVALLSIAALAVLPQLKQQVLRDREEEMRHRGTAYMRAIQRYYKKNGRYPARIEELENTNNIRYLRKRYKDPMSVDAETHKEKDFKLLRMGDKELSVLGSGPGGLGLNAGIRPPNGMPNLPGANQPPQSPNIINRPIGGAPTGGDTQPSGDNNTPTAATPDQGDTNGNNPPNQGPGGTGAGGPLQSNPAGGNNPLTLGGGPILGVTSTNKDKSIREFGDKIKHYNEWLFVYDPTADRGGLIQGPVVPNSLGGGAMGTPAGTMANQSQSGAGGKPPQGFPQQQAPQT